MINFVVLYVLMARHIHGLETRVLCVTLVKLVLAGAALAVVCVAAQRWMLADLAHMAFAPKLVGVLATIFVAAAVFGLAIYLLKVDEVHDLSRLVARKFFARAKQS